MLSDFVGSKVSVVWRDAQRAFSDDWPDQFTLWGIEQLGSQVWLTVKTADNILAALPLAEILYIEDANGPHPFANAEPQALTEGTPTIKLTPGT